mmetsp:Transcript_1302/g.1966  ORF Transcript_1302/g.1966 Transcript_1302/m.1966 type:complete len:145 (-) Transcript_1302:784-1218(-)|eukprot:CAMPEP_0184672328 /NCGR_PEP_ID=MMETSP0308-20130426/86040_1 /TAXON_ID=38269 /ORGANISM="Gloeochaete witrockiana, Strain SAG 46.84" /LENGTH=144 /DNA_ID=CAMNT_0027119643 /DNA_START=99 /DNA_END=533 /DNA_ORIENTATION=+
MASPINLSDYIGAEGNSPQLESLKSEDDSTIVLIEEDGVEFQRLSSRTLERMLKNGDVVAPSAIEDDEEWTRQSSTSSIPASVNSTPVHEWPDHNNGPSMWEASATDSSSSAIRSYDGQVDATTEEVMHMWGTFVDRNSLDEYY